MERIKLYTMTIKEELKRYCLYYGKRGVEDCENYVDIIPIRTIITVEEATPYKRLKMVNIHQLCYFADNDEVQAYCLDNDNNGWFCEWEKLSKSARKKILDLILAFD